MDRPTEPMPMKKYEPPICLQLTKEQVKGLSMGEKAKFSVEGTISGMHSPMEDDGKFSVDLKDYSVSGIETNSADRSLREMKSASRGKNDADKAMDHLKTYSKGK